jgi:hypothetical protein
MKIIFLFPNINSNLGIVGCFIIITLIFVFAVSGLENLPEIAIKSAKSHKI